MYQLYRRSEADEWQAYMHNDWLETLITFGRLGAAPIFLSALLVFFHWFWSGGIYGNKIFCPAVVGFLGRMPDSRLLRFSISNSLGLGFVPGALRGVELSLAALGGVLECE